MTDPDRPLDWATKRDMSPLEAVMWRAEGDPRLRATICTLDLLDTAPEWERLVAAHDWGTRMAPRFRQKVVEPPLFGRPAWVVDPHFDLAYHLRRVRLPGPAGWGELFTAAAQVAMVPFDRARPPWEAILFEGLPEGRAAYLLKTHHSTSDGLGNIQLLSRLHSRTREPSPAKPQPPAPPPEHTAGVDVFGRQIADDLAELPAGLARGAGAALRSISRPLASARETWELATSLGRVLAPPDAEGSPLLRGRSLSWRFLALDVAFADLRGAAKAAGGSVNDGYLAALLGGFRRYHEALGRPIERMPVAIPISLRRAGDSAGGNRFAGARFAAPVGLADPAARIRRIGEIVRGLRAEPALDALGILTPALSRLPAPILGAIAGSLTQANDLQASNVPGIREEVFLAGAKIERAYGFGPLPGCAVMATLVTHGETACLAVNLDAAAVTDRDLFGRSLEQGFAEVLALHPGAAAPVLRL